MLTSHGGYSPAEGRRNRKRLMRELEADAKKRHTARIRKLEEEERKAKEHRRKALADARGRCHAGVHRAREQAALRYAEAKAAADRAWEAARDARMAARKAERQAALDVCEVDRQHVEQEEGAKIAAAQKKKDEEKRYKAELASINRINRARDKARPKSSAAERRSESDDEVLASLPEGLHPLWQKMRRGVKATDRKNRLEAFLEYVEGHQDEVIAAQEETAQRELAREQREYFAQQGGRPRSRRQAQADALADVPF